MEGTRLQFHDRRSEADRAYWLSQFSTPSRPASLPSDFPRRPDLSPDYHVLPFTLAAGASAALQRVTAGSEFLLHAALHASLLVCLLRSSGEAEGGLLCLGVPARLRQPARPAASPAAPSQALAVVVEVSPELTFRALLGATREALLAAYEHQHYPLDRLARELSGEGGRLFETLLACDGVHGAAWPRAGQDLNVRVWRGAGGIEGEVHYLPWLHRRESVEWLVRRLGAAVEGGLSEPGTRLAELAVLSEEERALVLGAWATNSAGEQDDEAGREWASVTEMVREAARHRPSVTAVEQGGRRVTYGELWKMAGWVAARLLGLGVGHESVVGLCAGRGVEMVAGALGVMRAGGAYLPLDAGQPEARLSGMVEEAGVRVVVRDAGVGEAARGAWAGMEGVHEVVLEEGEGERAEAEVLEGEAGGGDEDVEVSCASAAYVIYTSGSTGRPKGVVATHGGLTNLVRARIGLLNLTDESRVLLSIPYSFDPSVADIFMTLAAGATLCLGRQDAEFFGPGLLKELRDGRITHLTIPHSTLLALSPEPLPSLRTLICGGEACSAEVVERWAEGRRFLNAYGPTETTVEATMEECRVGEGRPSIGRPMPGAELYVLDRGGRPCGVGAPGELHVGGRGVARGYLKRAALTAERFVPHPFSEEPGARLYRTGDTVRYLPDGKVEYLGRADRQVKVRGYRIELGEVEAHLRQHPSVREAVVVAREDGSGTKQLVAYVVGPHDQSLSGQQLAGFVRQRLPEFMVPAAFVLMPALPLTASGKIDQAALPAPEPGGLGSPDEFAVPRTPVEEVLAGIWAEVLGLEQVGVNDNFFDLGGQSLLATQVLFRLHSAFEVDLPVRALFDAPTVAGLAGLIEDARRAGSGIAAPPIRRVPRGGEHPLSFAQQRLWFLDQLEPGRANYNVPGSVRLKGRLNVRALEMSLTEIVRRHEVLRTTFGSVDGRAVQLIHPSMDVRLPVIDLQALAPEAREAAATRLAADEARRPFDLAAGPLLRASLLRLGEEDHALLFTMHHIVSDAWSTGVLIKETVALYEAYDGGRLPRLPELPVQYLDYAVWQREWLQGEVLEAQLAYWKKQLGGGLAPLALPADRPRPALPRHRGASAVFTLTPELSRQLRLLSRREGVTLFMTLLGAFQTLLYRYSGQSDIVVGSPINNRGKLETEGLIGFFVNTLALRTDLSGNPTFRELLRRVREVALGAYTHQDLPFEKLVTVLQTERELNRQSLYQVWFVLQDAPMPGLVLPGLEVGAVPVTLGISKFDLALSMWDAPEGIGGSLQYDTDLFDQATAAEMVEHFQNLLKAAAEDPELQLLDIPLLGEAEGYAAEEPAGLDAPGAFVL